MTFEEANRNVRFAADTKDNSKPELNLQTLEEILLKQNDDKEGLMIEPVTLPNGQKKNLIIAGTVEKLVQFTFSLSHFPGFTTYRFFSSR